MHQRIQINHPTARWALRPAAGFTLTELLVVIAIIGLLVGLVVPSLSGARKLAYKTKTDVRIKALSDGCSLFFEDTGRRYYPGQRYASALTGTYPGTGSEVLAISLFSNKQDIWFKDSDKKFYKADDHNNDIDRSDLRNFKGYIEYSDEYFKAGDPNSLTLYDCFTGSNKPICYYPSRLGVPNSDHPGSTMDSQSFAHFAKYPYNDNAVYTGPTAQEQADNIKNGHKAKAFCDVSDPDKPAGLIADPKFTGTAVQPYNADSFLLIAPGIDRAYFTSDDQKNF